MHNLENSLILRNSQLFTQRTILLCGGVTTTIADQPIGSQLISSAYYDVIKPYLQTNITAEFTIFPSNELLAQADTIIYYWVKNKQEALMQLTYLIHHLQITQQLLVVGHNKSGVKAIANEFKQYGSFHKLDSAKHCLLFNFNLHTNCTFNLNDYWQSYHISEQKIDSLVGTYGTKQLDLGTELLLQNLPELITEKVLDLGCGTGIIGLNLKLKYASIQLSMTDINAMALASSKRNFEQYQLQANIYASDVFSDITDQFDLIISNPPFHNGTETNYRVINLLAQQAKDHLTANGELRIVANSFLPYTEILAEHFTNYKIIAHTNKFKVYSAFK